MTDDTNKRLAAIQRKVNASLKDPGWFVFSVFASPEERFPAFAYTLGLSLNFGHPELCMTGLPADVIGSIVNDAAKKIAAKHATYDAGSTVPANMLVADRPLQIRAVRADAAREHFIQAKNILGYEPEFVQLVWPDPNGHFPGTPEWDTRYDVAQPDLWTPVRSKPGPRLH
jgi:hypothetical protein